MSTPHQFSFTNTAGATPLDHEDMNGLLPKWITTRSDLDAAEQENIMNAMVWAFTPQRPWEIATLLDRQMLADIHRRMFGEVWRWAGTWRQRETNIGVEPHRILPELENLLGDVRVQTVDPGRLAWPADEIAIRFHHRLVSIHLFPNGNGRHARLVTDLLVIALNRPRFSWGFTGQQVSTPQIRSTYLKALRIADTTLDYTPLLHFARS
jgi:Fic-DOC domain mobile mystery protein B